MPGLTTPFWKIRSLIARRVERPESYNALQRLVGSQRVWDVFINEHLRPAPGMRVLDLGCGPAEILSFLPEMDYLGVDIHPPYIEGARARYGDRGRFRACAVQDLVAEGAAPFDVVLALGLLHHLTDAEAAGILAAAARLTAPGGRLLTLDGCLEPGQSPIARLCFKADRGNYTRDRAGYEALLRPHFPQLSGSVRHDLLRLPYTYLILEARPGGVDG